MNRKDEGSPLIDGTLPKDKQDDGQDAADSLLNLDKARGDMYSSFTQALKKLGQEEDRAEIVEYRRKERRDLIGTSLVASAVVGCLLGYLIGKANKDTPTYPDSPESIIEMTAQPGFQDALGQLTSKQQDMIREALHTLCQPERQANWKERSSSLPTSDSITNRRG